MNDNYRVHAFVFFPVSFIALLLTFKPAAAGRTFSAFHLPPLLQINPNLINRYPATNRQVTAMKTW